MMKILFPLFFVLLLGCAKQQVQVPQLGALSPENISFKIDYDLSPGEVVLIRFPHFYSELAGELVCQDQVLPYHKQGDDLVAFVHASYFAELKAFECFYKVGTRDIRVAQIEMIEKIFPSERLNVDMRHVSLSPKDQARVDEEQIFLNSVYKLSPPRPYFTKAFIVPLNTHITSIYGARRVFNNEKQTQHLGTDFRAMPGVPIVTANAGKVVVARELFYTGLTVTIDHGMGIFTVYGHLSKIQATEGEFVPLGAQIGLSGATGRVTGPHLHWGVRVQGHFIDGHSLVRASERAFL